MKPKYIIAIVVIGGIIFMLSRGSISSGNLPNILYSLVLLTFVGSGLIVHLKHMKVSQVVYNIGLWVVLFLGIILAYSFRHDFESVKNRITGELVPTKAIENKDGALEFRKASDGHFHINVLVDGEPVQFLLDTGASDVVINMQTAKKLGYDKSNLIFNKVYNTANGQVYGAPIIIRTIEIGGYEFRNIKASVNSSDMNTSLLGMSFLEKLDGYEVKNNILTLWP